MLCSPIWKKTVLSDDNLMGFGLALIPGSDEYFLRLFAGKDIFVKLTRLDPKSCI